MKNILFLITTIIAGYTFADYKDTGNVTIKLVSVWTDSGDILVQTNPRHDISGLNCSSDYWLKLNKSNPGYEGALSILLSAQATQSKVTVRAYDDQGTDFCRLDRVIIESL